MKKITKVKIKDKKRVIKLFNNNKLNKIWNEIRKDFKDYAWDSAEIHIKNEEIFILFTNIVKKTN